MHPLAEKSTVRRRGRGLTSFGYQVRVSNRAKNPRLKLSAREGLVVVVPNGFDEALIPSILARNREWIRRNEERLQQQIKFLEPRVTGGLPERISLRAVGQEWCVTYRHRMGIGVTAVERGGQQLLVHGDIHNDSAVLDALQRWLSRKTREHIVGGLSRWRASDDTTLAVWRSDLSEPAGLAVQQREQSV